MHAQYAWLFIFPTAEIFFSVYFLARNFFIELIYSQYGIIIFIFAPSHHHHRLLSCAIAPPC